ncbi:MAG: protein kinase domain-containing protein [Giesbergeria sp.]
MTDSKSSETRASMRHMDALQAGTRLAEFEILSLLGVGGFGMVYQAFDHSLHRSVAIKEYMPTALASRASDGALWARSSTDEPAFQAGLHSFVDEARMLAQFDHPSLVKVFRFWEAHNTAYMVMPLYRGMTFKQARAQMRSPPPEAWLRQVLWAVLDALRVLHEANALHRDISPDNIFLQDVGPPVLLDLGASRHAINDRDRKHTAVLKVNYAPIEQYSDSDGDGAGVVTGELEQGPWSDLYSLAAVVHGCLCNDAPLPATLRSLRDRMTPFSRVARTVGTQFGQAYSAPFVHAISGALKLNPKDRPQSIDEFLALMEMGVAPAGLDHFDFRVGLGDIWVEPTDYPDAALTATTVDLTGQPPLADAVAKEQGAAVSGPLPQKPVAPLVVAEPVEAAARAEVVDTIFVERDSAYREQDTVFLDPDSVQSAEPAASGRTASGSKPVLESEWTRDKAEMPGRRSLGVWLIAGIFGLAVGAVVWALRTPPQAPLAKEPVADVIITESKPPAEAPQAAASQQSDVDALAAQAAASESSASEEDVSSAFVVSDDPRAVSKTPPRPARVSKSIKEPIQAVPATPQEPDPAPAQLPALVPVPVARKAPPPPCENTSAFTRSMCLREECRKPSNAGRDACVEFRKAMEPLERNNFAN